jgi:serine/threonine protein kinase
MDHHGLLPWREYSDIGIVLLPQFSQQMEAGRIEERYIAIIMREVLLALAYVHKCGIIHRDIKGSLSHVLY